MTIRLIVVDGGGVLCNGVPEPMLKLLAEKYKDEKIIKLHKTNYDCWNKIKLQSEYDESQYFKDLFKDSKVTENIQELSSLLRTTMNLHQDTANVLRKLHEKHKHLEFGVVSNHATAWFDYLLQQNKQTLSTLFSKKELILVSQTVNLAKPDPKIFDLLLKRARETLDSNLKPNEIVFIDDKMENVKAAQSVGIQSFLFDHDKEPIQNFEDKLIALLK